jgi:hypothetical protein
MLLRTYATYHGLAGCAVIVDHRCLATSIFKSSTSIGHALHLGTLPCIYVRHIDPAPLRGAPPLFNYLLGSSSFLGDLQACGGHAQLGARTSPSIDAGVALRPQRRYDTIRPWPPRASLLQPTPLVEKWATVYAFSTGSRVNRY